MSGRPWILVVPHPDDETLGCGVTFAEHIAAGREVHILLLTRGTSSTVRLQLNGDRLSNWWGVVHDPAAEGYAPLDQAAFGAARVDELRTAMRCLGGGQVHEAGLTDGSVTVEQVKAAIADVVAQVAPGAGVYAPSWVVDDNPDHIAAGTALRELQADQPTVYWDCRWYVLPRYWSDPRLAQVPSFWDCPTDGTITARARNAYKAYGAWHPPYSYAVGYHSVRDMFATVEANTKSLLHK